jgi:hypothetical protein
MRWPRRAKRPKSAARVKAPTGRSFHWPSLQLRRPRWSWNYSLNIPGRAYRVAAGVTVVAIVLAVSAGLVVLLKSHGPQLYPVRGQVFYKGKPAAGALVVFFPKDSGGPGTQAASSLVNKDGSYVLGTHKANDGAFAGSYVVTIWMQKNVTDRLPASYGSRQTTPLTATVEMGPTEVPMFQLQAESHWLHGTLFFVKGIPWHVKGFASGTKPGSFQTACEGMDYHPTLLSKPD